MTATWRSRRYRCYFSRLVPQLPPIHLSQVRRRKRFHEDDLPWVLVRLQPVADERLQLLRQAVPALARDHVGAWLDQAVRIGHPHDRDLGDGGMLKQAALDLGRREPLSRHLEQLVGPPAVGEVAVRVPPDQVAGHHPFPAKAALTLVELLPVAQRPRAAPHPQMTDRPVGHLLALLIRHLDLEPRHHLAQRAPPHPPRTIGEEDVPLLRGAESVEQRDVEGAVPPGVQLLRQTLARRRRQAEAGEVLPGRVRMAQHLVDHRGHGDQDARPVAGDRG